MAKENKVEIKPVVKEAKEVVFTLAFRVKDCGDNLFAPEMLLLEGDVVMAKRLGTITSLGHAAGAATDLLDAWAVQEIDLEPTEFYKNVYL